MRLKVLKRRLTPEEWKERLLAAQERGNIFRRIARQVLKDIRKVKTVPNKDVAELAKCEAFQEMIGQLLREKWRKEGSI